MKILFSMSLALNIFLLVRILLFIDDYFLLKMIHKLVQVQVMKDNGKFKRVNAIDTYVIISKISNEYMNNKLNVKKTIQYANQLDRIIKSAKK